MIRCAIFLFVFIAIFSLAKEICADSEVESAKPQDSSVPQAVTKDTVLNKEEAHTVEIKNMFSDELERKLSFDDFLKELAENNLAYAAQTFNVPIAEAQISLAKLWPNPIISGGYNTPIFVSRLLNGSDYTAGLNKVPNQDPPSTISASISQTILLGGKLSARTDVAKKTASQAKAQLEDFFRILRATAANAYVDTLTAQLTVQRKLLSQESLDQLVDLTQKRFKAGDIGEVDFLQSRIIALQAHNDLAAALSTMRQASVNLTTFLGKNKEFKLVHAVGSLEILSRKFDAAKLIADAVMNRSDVMAAVAAHEIADAQLQVARANRIPDVTVGFNYAHNTESTSSISPTPKNDFVGFNISLPIPLSDFNTNDLKAGNLAILQAEKNLAAAQLKAELDIRQGSARYELAASAVEQYSKELLQSAENVLKRKLYSYQHGNTSLLEVLNAQKDLNDIYLSYYTALNEQVKALINLEQAAGIWDIVF